MARVELTAEENLLLLQEIEANRAFMLLAYQSDPALLKLADPEIRRLFENVDDQPLGQNVGGDQAIFTKEA